MGGSDIEDYDEDDFDRDEVLSVTSSVKADTYVRRVLKAAGAAARDALFERFATRARETVMISMPLQPLSEPVHVGGATPLSKAQSDKFYDFFQYVDSLHDFAADIGPDNIADSLGAELPEIFLNGNWHRMEVSKICGPDATFVQDITAAEKIRFDGVPEFDNPLRERDFEQGMFKYDGDWDIQSQVDNLPRPCDGCKHIEIWSFTDGAMKILKLEQIVDAVSKINLNFGAHATFVVDESAPLTRLLLAMDLIYKSFLNSFRIEATSKEDTWEIASWWKVWKELTTTWKAMTCDSGLMDAEAHDFELHDAPTGRVFRDGSLVQIEMLSSSVVKSGKKVEKKYKYRLSSDTIPVWRDQREQIIEVTNDKIGGVREYYSKAEMIGVIRTYLKDERNIAVPLAQKRAGDWGQVEHCKKYNMVFVTADKITALFAIYRGVRVMYVHTWRRAEDMQRTWDVESMEDLYRWSFVLCHPILKDKQAGGSVAHGVIQPILLATVVALAFASSLF